MNNSCLPDNSDPDSTASNSQTLDTKIVILKVESEQAKNQMVNILKNTTPGQSDTNPTMDAASQGLGGDQRASSAQAPAMNNSCLPDKDGADSDRDSTASNSKTPDTKIVTLKVESEQAKNQMANILKNTTPGQSDTDPTMDGSSQGLSGDGRASSAQAPTMNNSCLPDNSDPDSTASNSKTLDSKIGIPKVESEQAKNQMANILKDTTPGQSDTNPTMDAASQGLGAAGGGKNNSNSDSNSDRVTTAGSNMNMASSVVGRTATSYSANGWTVVNDPNSNVAHAAMPNHNAIATDMATTIPTPLGEITHNQGAAFTTGDQTSDLDDSTGPEDNEDKDAYSEYEGKTLVSFSRRKSVADVEFTIGENNLVPQSNQHNQSLTLSTSNSHQKNVVIPASTLPISAVATPEQQTRKPAKSSSDSHVTAAREEVFRAPKVGSVQYGFVATSPRSTASPFIRQSAASRKAAFRARDARLANTIAQPVGGTPQGRAHINEGAMGPGLAGTKSVEGKEPVLRLARPPVQAAPRLQRPPLGVSEIRRPAQSSQRLAGPPVGVSSQRLAGPPVGVSSKRLPQTHAQNPTAAGLVVPPVRVQYIPRHALFGPANNTYTQNTAAQNAVARTSSAVANRPARPLYVPRHQRNALVKDSKTGVADNAIAESSADVAARLARQGSNSQSVTPFKIEDYDLEESEQDSSDARKDFTGRSKEDARTPILKALGVVCEHVAECDTNSPFRRAISNYFGRNKACVRDIPEQIWVHYCRKHYQRCRFRDDHGWTRKLCEMIRSQFDRIETWSNNNRAANYGPVVTHWTILLRKREAERVRVESLRKKNAKKAAAKTKGKDKGPATSDDEDEDSELDESDDNGDEDEEVPEDDTVVATKETRPVPDWLIPMVGEHYTFDQIRTIFDRIARPVLASPTEKLPDVEFLPVISFLGGAQPAVISYKKRSPPATRNKAPKKVPAPKGVKRKRKEDEDGEESEDSPPAQRARPARSQAPRERYVPRYARRPSESPPRKPEAKRD